jgi:hypothetical protein
MSKTETLTKYREYAEVLWDLRSDEVFSNGKGEHAAVILETFLLKARSRVLLFCKNLASSVFERTSMRDAVLDALSRKIIVEIICQEEPESVSFVHSVRKWEAEGRSIRLNVATDVSVSKLAWNFAVADGHAYRFEKNNQVTKAVACMNDTKLGESFEGLFATIRGRVEDKSDISSMVAFA